MSVFLLDMLLKKKRYEEYFHFSMFESTCRVKLHMHRSYFVQNISFSIADLHDSALCRAETAESKSA